MEILSDTNVRDATPWQDYMDGQTRRATQGEDFAGSAYTWAQAGAQWARRHGAKMTYRVCASEDPVRVKFRIEPRRLPAGA